MRLLLVLMLSGCAEVVPLTKEAIQTRIRDHCPVKHENEVVIPIHIIIDVSTKE